MRALIILALTAGSAHGACLWSDPGAHRFVGNPVDAVMSYGDIPPLARAELAEAVRLRAYSEIAEIRRDSIGGGKFTNMRAMHWGDGQQCMGDVDRSGWAPSHVERGLVYCVRGHCVIVPTVCGNVARVNMAGVRPQPDPVPRRKGFALPSAAPAVRSVPEPGALALVGIALAALALSRRRG